MYHQMTDADISALKELIAPERVLRRKEISADYSHDELGGIEAYPEALVRVESTEEVSRVMRYASEHHIPVVARGSGGWKK